LRLLLAVVLLHVGKINDDDDDENNNNGELQNLNLTFGVTRSFCAQKNSEEKQNSYEHCVLNKPPEFCTTVFTHYFVVTLYVLACFSLPCTW